METKANTLHVLYQPFRRLPENALVLSFLPPDAEYKFALDNKVRLLYGRREMDAVREKARKAYIDLVARIAATPCNGKTLRQALHMQDRTNPWWYHKVSEKDAESDDTFNMILHFFTILYIAEREHIEDISLYGSQIEIAQVLSTRYHIKRIKCISRWKNNFIRGALSRLKYLCWALYCYSALRNKPVLTGKNTDVVFHGLWDATFQMDEQGGEAKDNYFKSLPGHLSEKGMGCAWFLWLDPYSKPSSRRRPLYKILKPAIDNPSFVFVQKFLKLTDIISAIFDLRPLCRYLRYYRKNEFRGLFKQEGCDFWPLFGRKMFYYFSDASIPQYFLMESAYRRAFAYFKPKLTLTFMELFLSSRAFNQGARLGSPQTIKCDMQHASYGREKTFILMDQNREFLGQPDNVAIPRPDYFFAMGELFRDILVECGFPLEKIFVTGSARYDHIKIEEREFSINKDSGAVRVLLVPTLNIRLDFEMVQAAFLAAKGLNIKLCLRSHPFVAMEEAPLYKRYADSIISSSNSLEQDLDSTDLVLFTYSTVAEEAFLRGIPILRWQTAGFNGSVFRDINIVPSVYSAEGLREAFKSFIAHPSSFRPNQEFKDFILQKCFYKADGRASLRIAEKIAEILNLKYEKSITQYA